MDSCTKELILDAQRAALLALHAFCVRLMNEDFTFIRRFVQRHLCLNTAYKGPYLFQDLSPSATPTVSHEFHLGVAIRYFRNLCALRLTDFMFALSTFISGSCSETDEMKYNIQKCYKRLSFSVHLPHILLAKQHDLGPDSEAIDRKFLEYFGPDQGPKSIRNKECLYRSASSIFLSLVVPEEQESREEAQDLLANPEALWTVLAINTPLNMGYGFQRDPAEFLTPLAQFIRGICGAIRSQKAHAIIIFDGLKEKLLDGTVRIQHPLRHARRS